MKDVEPVERDEAHVALRPWPGRRSDARRCIARKAERGLGLFDRHARQLTTRHCRGAGSLARSRGRPRAGRGPGRHKRGGAALRATTARWPSTSRVNDCASIHGTSRAGSDVSAARSRKLHCPRLGDDARGEPEPSLELARDVAWALHPRRRGHLHRRRGAGRHLRGRGDERGQRRGRRKARGASVESPQARRRRRGPVRRGPRHDADVSARRHRTRARRRYFAASSPCYEWHARCLSPGTVRAPSPTAA